MSITIREAYGETLKRLAAENSKLVVLEADVGGSTKSSIFGKAYPDRYFNVGISEIHMVSMAAGFARCGMVPFANTFAVFMALRAADPVNSLICYDKLNVKLAGAYGGMSDAYDGASHHALCDIAVMRSLPNMTIISVCDAVQTLKAVQAAAEYNGPVYLRLSREAMPDIYQTDSPFAIGSANLLTDGADVAIFATGMMVHQALAAANLLKQQGIEASVTDIHTIKPIDEKAVVAAAAKVKCVVTAEEHNIIGGLGSAVAEVLTKTCPRKMAFVGVEDTFTESGAYKSLLKKYGLSAENIVQKVLHLLK